MLRAIAHSERIGLRQYVKPAALILSSVVSAYLMTRSIASPGFPWLGCVALLPLLMVIRTCRPLHAVLYGGLWGASLYVFAVADGDTGISRGLLPLVLLTTIPATYACLGALLTRRIGFSPFVLGVGWMGVELALEPLGLRDSLLAGTQRDGTVLFWIGQALGYVLAGSLVAYFSALVVTLLSAVRLVSATARVTGSAEPDGTTLIPQTTACLPLLSVSLSRPRAPPTS